MKRRPPRNHAARRTGFTIIELLVSIGIIAVLGSIVVVLAARARKSANKSVLAFQIQAIQTGLEAYKTDFNSFPITTIQTPILTSGADYYVNLEGLRGARTLCKALMGATDQGPVGTGTAPSYANNLAHEDGANGYGFRVPPRSGAFSFDTSKNPVEVAGKVYGPYLDPSKFKVSNTVSAASGGKKMGELTTDAMAPTGGTAGKYDDTAVILDANDNVILYYPLLNPSAPLGVEFAYAQQGYATAGTTTAESGTKFAGTPMYESNDNSAWLAAPAFRKQLGDTNGDHKILPPETPAARNKYVLWSAGPDGFFGPNPATSGKEAGVVDDVTNFQE